MLRNEASTKEVFMKVRLLLATLITAATPGLALAMCSGYGHEQQATMSCPEGQTYDAATQNCTPPATG